MKIRIGIRLGIAALFIWIHPISRGADTTISPRTKGFVNEHWNNKSFRQGIAIVADTKETATSRAAAMQSLYANRIKLTPDETLNFLSEATRLAKDTSLDEMNSAFAVSAMANLTLTMRDQGLLSEEESKQEAAFLVATATDSRRNVQLRSSAIVALGILKVTAASGALRELLTNSPVEIARPACLSLMRVDGDRAIPDLADILKKTKEARLFGTAAFALGQLKKSECVAALVDNLGRFPDSGACDAALVDMADVICGILKNPQDENLIAAVQATRYLWREGQRELYTPLLRNLLSDAPMVARKTATERLVDSASQLDFESEKRELALVMIAISNQTELEEYRERIQNRLSASVLVPNATNKVIPPAFK